MKNKLNWGWGIALVYIFFAVATLAFVIFSRFHQMDLVTKEYYEEELKYEEQINRQKRTSALEHGLQWEFARAAKTVILKFPKNLAENAITGNIMFFRPSDATQDNIIPIQLSEEAHQLVNVAHLSPGKWRMKIFWNVGEQEYYNEDILFIE
jgi:hypothetical protein